MVLGPDGRATEANPAIAEMLGRTRRRSSPSRASATYTHPDDVASTATALFAEMMSGRSESHQVEVRYCHAAAR